MPSGDSAGQPFDDGRWPFRRGRFLRAAL